MFTNSKINRQGHNTITISGFCIFSSTINSKSDSLTSQRITTRSQSNLKRSVCPTTKSSCAFNSISRSITRNNSQLTLSRRCLIKIITCKIILHSINTITQTRQSKRSNTFTISITIILLTIYSESN